MRKSLTTLATIASISRRASMGARSLLAFASRLAGKRVSQGRGLDGLGRLEQPCSLAAVQRCSGPCTWGPPLSPAAWQRWRPVKCACSYRPRFWVRLCCCLHGSVQTMVGAGPLKWLRPLAGGLAIW